MDGITKQTRRQSYDGIRTRSGERCKLILETLGNRSMTVEEITDELVAAGHLKYYDRNFVAPRLTELKRRRSSGSCRKETEQKNWKKYSRMGCGKEVST